MKNKSSDIQKCQECGLFFENLRMIPDTFCVKCALDIGWDSTVKGRHIETVKIVVPKSSDAGYVEKTVRNRIEWKFDELIRREFLSIYINEICVGRCVRAAARAVIDFCKDSE